MTMQYKYTMYRSHRSKDISAKLLQTLHHFHHHASWSFWSTSPEGFLKFLSKGGYVGAEKVFWAKLNSDICRGFWNLDQLWKMFLSQEAIQRSGTLGLVSGLLEFVLGSVLVLGIGFIKYGLGLNQEFVRNNFCVFFSLWFQEVW